MPVPATTFHRSQHLIDADLGPVHRACPICASDRLVSVRALQDDPRVDLMRCRNCHVCAASRFPTDAALERYYSHYYLHTGRSGAQVTMDNSGVFARHIARVIQSELPSGPIGILDFGGGDGTIARQLAQAFVQAGHPAVGVTVVDYHSATVPGTPAITVTHQSDLESVAGPYDVILASAILEHLPGADATTQRLLHLLRPGGVLYVRTPYIVPLMTLLGRVGLPIDFTFPGHLFDMGQAFWENYFAARPCRILRSQPSLVETSFGAHFARTCAAHLLKLPWWVIGRRYTLVGGWEIFVKRT